MNSIQWKRFQELRQRALSDTLSASEQCELTALIQEIERAEVAQLAPASVGVQREFERVEAQNRALEMLVRRKEALLERLRVVLAEMQTERRRIQDEQSRILTGTAGSGTGPAG